MQLSQRRKNDDTWRLMRRAQQAAAKCYVLRVHVNLMTSRSLL